jgi:hypothetical protein
MFCAAVCAVLTFRFSFFSGHRADPGKGTILDFLTAASTPWLLIVGVVIALGVLVDIFLYKNRSRQTLITIGLIILSLVNILLYWFAHKNYVDGTFSLSALLALAIPVFLILACRGIIKDQKLVKSVDRLR